MALLVQEFWGEFFFLQNPFSAILGQKNLMINLIDGGGFKALVVGPLEKNNFLAASLICRSLSRTELIFYAFSQ